MDENDIAKVVIITITAALSCIGAGTLIFDYRNFDTITEQCKAQGYIQDKTTRIHCIVEDKK